MKKTLLFTICCLMFGSITTVSLGQEKKPNGEMVDKLFARIDKNSDGTLDGDELPEKIKEKLTKLDANSDGKIDKTELAAAREHRMGQKPTGERGKPGANEAQARSTQARVHPTQSWCGNAQTLG